jgi:hypothetical protein
VPKKKYTRTEAFAEYGAKGKNARWSWSARNEDEKIIVLTLWQNELIRDGKNLAYYSKARKDAVEWSNKLGNKERLENLKWCMENCDGRFRVVIAIAKDDKAVPRSIKECFPKKELIMRITDLNEETGEFQAISD